MTSKKFLALCVVFALVLGLGLVGCGPEEVEPDPEEPEEEAVSEEPGDMLRIGYAPATYDPADYMGQFGAGLYETLAEWGEEGVDYEVITRSPGDHSAHAEQAAIVDDLIALDMDYILIHPSDYEGQQGTYERVMDAGIKLMLTAYSDPFPEEWGIDQGWAFFGFSHEDGGTVITDWIIDTFPEGAKIGVVHGSPGYVTEVRTQTDKLEEAGMDIVIEEYGEYARGPSADIAERMLTAHPDLDILLTASSAIAMGVIEAVESMRDLGLYDGDVAITGAGGTIEELDAICEGKMAAVWARCPIQIGMAAANNIIADWEGRDADVLFTFNAENVVLTSCEEISEWAHEVTYHSVGRTGCPGGHFEFPEN